MSDTRMVHCRKLGKELPGLKRPPFKNEMGQRIFDEISKEAWDEWIRFSVRIVNTYCRPGTRYDVTTREGQAFMLDQCAIFFGYKEGDAAETAFTAPEE